MSRLRIGLLFLILAVGALIATPFMRGTTTLYEVSVTCNISMEALDQPSAALTHENSVCFTKELADEWRYIIGEYGWFSGTTVISDSFRPDDLFVAIANSQTRLSPGYARFCSEMIQSALANQSAELVNIARLDPRGAASLTCPSEESKGAT
ncbi:MAG: hypothetical protein GKR99_11270 [Rhodobacteraceae bacterium]|nr:hypothetical protein [Paracoccaceae bacterium]